VISKAYFYQISSQFWVKEMTKSASDTNKYPIFYPVTSFKYEDSFIHIKKIKKF
jgi:hypothetical protein